MDHRRTLAGTHLVKNVLVSSLMSAGDGLAFFRGNGLDGAGYDAWVTDGTNTGTFRLVDLPTNQSGVYDDYDFTSVAGPSAIPTPGNDALVGSDGPDIIDGLAGDDIIRDLAGNDMLFGGDGDDNLFGGAGADQLIGDADTDYARYDLATAGVTARLDQPNLNTGEAAGDSYSSIQGLVGSAYADTLVGSDGGNETIFGLGGNDVILGLGGADTLYGGGGNDNFAFQAADFQSGVYDRIKDLNNVAGDNDIITLIGVPAAQLQLFDTSSGALITTAALGGNGGVIVEGHTAAQIAPQVFLT